MRLGPKKRIITGGACELDDTSVFCKQVLDDRRVIVCDCNLEWSHLVCYATGGYCCDRIDITLFFDDALDPFTVTACHDHPQNRFVCIFTYFFDDDFDNLISRQKNKHTRNRCPDLLALWFEGSCKLFGHVGILVKKFSKPVSVVLLQSETGFSCTRVFVKRPHKER